MRPVWIGGIFALVAAAVVPLAARNPVGRTPPAVAPASGPVEAGTCASGRTASPASLPLHFERNDGQTARRVSFLARADGSTVFLEPDCATFATPGAAVRMRVVGAHAAAAISGAEPLAGHANYLIGRDPSKWTTDVPLYARVVAEEVYPGIDVAWYGDGRRLEYDFCVAPDADPSQIALAFEGADSVTLADDGALVLRVGDRELRHDRPVVWETGDAGRREVDGRFVVRDDGLVAFAVADRTPGSLLTIDPLVSWSDYVGGSGRDECEGVAVDGQKNAYVTGTTQSLDFPTKTGAFATTAKGGDTDTFVTKLNAAGNAIVYSTYVGGTEGEESHGIAVDKESRATICGFTYSQDFPATALDTVLDDGVNLTGDAFVTRLNAAGNGLAWSTYLGGTGQDTANDVAVDSAGVAWVVGNTSSTDFPLASEIDASSEGSQDAFLTSIAADGASLRFSTYLGGPDNDTGDGVAIREGDVWIAGKFSTNRQVPPLPVFPGVTPVRAFAGYDDLWVGRVHPATSSWVWMSFLGGQYSEISLSASDQFARVAVDASGNAFVCGSTDSPDFPAGSGTARTDQSGTDGFVSKLSTTGSLLWTRFLSSDPSTSTDTAADIAVDSKGRAHVVGTTEGYVFPVVGATQPEQGGYEDAFYSIVKADGSGFDFSTYLGGESYEWARGIALASDGSATVAGRTYGSFPVVGGVQEFYRQNGDGFVTRFGATAGTALVFKVKRGLFMDSTKYFKDKAALVGSIPLPKTFDPRSSYLRFFVTDGNDRGLLDILGVTAADPRWKKRGTVYTLKYEVPDGIHATLAIDVKRRTFAFGAKDFSFPGAPANPIRVTLEFPDAGLNFTTTQTWRAQPGGKLRLP
ncbi:MAG: SBBP repeat-containing protein [Planctomycetes bacterium]|nr:SBBP repeat-containing protein [Planctomycetota bacterium]